MALAIDRRWWRGYLTRVAVLHVATYLVVGTAFLAVPDALTPADLVAIEFLQPYRLAPLAVAVQALRGVAIALVFYPFYRLAADTDRGWWVLFVPLWGLTVVGSIEPWLGSIEGLIYTEITPAAHLAFLAASAVQYALFVGGLRWLARRRPLDADRPAWLTAGWPDPRQLPFWGYLGRFTVVYVAAYLTAGVAFFVLHDYETVIPASEAFALWRPLDHPIVQFAVVFQVARGALLALLLVPLYGWIFDRPHGWLRLFAVLWGGIYLATPAAVPTLVADLTSPGPLRDLLFGTAELTVQFIAFAVLFWAWQRRSRRRRGTVDRGINRMSGD